MDMQQAYAGADLGRLEERLAEAAGENHRLRAALERIDGLNDNPACYNPEIDAVLRRVLNGRSR